MKYHSFYMRLLCLILIIGAFMGYNFVNKNNSQVQEITELQDRVTVLEKQQSEMLTAIDEAAKAREEAEAAAEEAKAQAAAAKTEDNSSKDTAENTDDAENTEESDEENVYKDGTYTGSGQGFGGAVEVQVTLANDSITDIQVTSASGEDSAYLSQAEGVINSIISAQSTDVDTVSGATFSSTGIINAVNDALGKAENQ